MYRRVVAFDYDGTLAENGSIPSDLCQALEQLAVSGYSLFLVTGRQYQTVDLGELEPMFAGIVWENGAVLSQQQSGELYIPFGHLDSQLIDALEQAGIPLERGLAIASTWSAHEAVVADMISSRGIDTVIAHNKGAVMLLPPGAAKGTGLERILELSGLSVRNVISFGDGENDLSLLQASEGGVAVANAVPALQSLADLVTSQPGPAGVLEALQQYWLNDQLSNFPSKHSQEILLGQDVQGSTVSIPSAALARDNIGIYGDSGTGKSWVTGLLVEGMHHAGYQVLVIDPEGDHRSLRSLPHMMALDGDQASLPTPAVVTLLLEQSSNSVVLDLCTYPVDKRMAYVAELVQRLHPLRQHRYRPHWIVLEEAQEFLSLASNAVATTLLPMLRDGGWALVTYRPDQLADEVRASLNRCLITRIQDTRVAQALTSGKQVPPLDALAKTRIGSVWLCGDKLVRLRAAGRRVPHIRHLYKYLDTPLPKHKRFYFRTETGFLGIEAASLFEFKELLATLPNASLAYHHLRGDFVRWIGDALGDEVLASHLEKLMHRSQLTGDSLRQALLERVNERYLMLYQAT